MRHIKVVVQLIDEDYPPASAQAAMIVTEDMMKDANMDVLGFSIGEVRRKLAKHLHLTGHKPLDGLAP